MAVRQIVKIDEEKCTGCGQCVDACAEAAIEIVDGKARLVGEVHCDGLGACLGICPEDAITIEEREAEPFDEHAVAERVRGQGHASDGCPSAAVRDLGREAGVEACPSAVPRQPAGDSPGQSLRNWPIQLALVPAQAPFLSGADLVLAADCTAFARPAILAELASGRPVLIACPKLDDAPAYVSKIADILTEASPRSLTIVHMVVPCCHGLAHVVRQALDRAKVSLPVSEVTVGIEGHVEAMQNWPSRPEAAARP